MVNVDKGTGGTPNGADGEGLIDPDLFPVRAADIDVDGVRAAATAFAGIGQRVTNGLDTLPASWSMLARPGVYESPHADQVHTLMGPAIQAGERFSNGASMASDAMTMFVATLVARLLPWRLSGLEDAAREFRDDALNGVPRPSRAVPLLNILDIGKDSTVPWYENLEYKQRNDELLAHYAQVLEDISEAACEAAESVQKIPGLPALPDPEPWDADAIAASPMPWGSPREADLTFDTQIALGVGSTAKNLLLSVPRMFGFDENGFDPKTALSAWTQTGRSTLGFLMFYGASKRNGQGLRATEKDIQKLLDSDDPLLRLLGQTMRDGEQMVMPYAAGNSIDLEDAARRWSQHPWQVGTETALAWVMLLAPGPKGAKGTPLSPKSQAMLDTMISKAELIQTGAGWYLKEGSRILDKSGRKLGDILYGGTRGKPGGTHMWRPGEAAPTPSNKPHSEGGKHLPGHRGLRKPLPRF